MISQLFPVRRRPRGASVALTRLGVVALLALPARAARAQAPSDTAYVPSMELPKERQIVAVYLGADFCGPCRKEEVKTAVRRMKPLLAAQAKGSGTAFAATIVSLDWTLKDALEFIEPLGAFDEYLLGANWVGTAAQRFLWADSLTSKALPQVIVLERTVTAGGRAITFGPDHVLRRVAGDAAIIQWVRAGARIAQR